MPIPGTEGGRGPFFSPDGEWVGFRAGNRLRKFSFRGDRAMDLCEAPGLQEATWGKDGKIVFSAGFRGLRSVSASGGSPESLTTVNVEEGEIATA